MIQIKTIGYMKKWRTRKSFAVINLLYFYFLHHMRISVGTQPLGVVHWNWRLTAGRGTSQENTF